MVYGAIDLHMRYSQIRIVDADGRVVREQRVVTSRERLDGGVRGPRADAHPARDGDGERVGGAGARGTPGTRWSWPIRITRRCMASCGGA